MIKNPLSLLKQLPVFHLQAADVQKALLDDPEGMHPVEHGVAAGGSFATAGSFQLVSVPVPPVGLPPHGPSQFLGG